MRACVGVAPNGPKKGAAVVRARHGLTKVPRAFANQQRLTRAIGDLPQQHFAAGIHDPICRVTAARVLRSRAEICVATGSYFPRRLAGALVVKLRAVYGVIVCALSIFT